MAQKHLEILALNTSDRGFCQIYRSDSLPRVAETAKRVQLLAKTRVRGEEVKG